MAVVGGANASDMIALLGELSARDRMAIVVHCDDASASSRLQAALPHVVEVQTPTKLESGYIYVVTETTPASLDQLFRSTADSYGAQSIGVLLAGSAPHGTLGIRRIHEVGGITIAQDGDAARGAVDLVLDVKDIPGYLTSIVQHRPSEDSAGDGDTLGDMLALVRVRTGHDFTAHKRAALSRRVSRRMQISQNTSIRAYHQHVSETPSELAALLRDFLIGVTNFFRDPQAFEAVARGVLPAMFASKERVRVWVPGCATGEEVFSLAILLDEHAREHGAVQPIQLFATDIDEDALADARVARYSTTISIDVNEQRLDRYFVRERGGYRIKPALRDLVLFSRHDLLRDPPFSRLDLISCRNLLVYLNRDAQDAIIKRFHFALRDDRYLFLGAAESAEHQTMFSGIDTKHRIYQRRPSAPQRIDPPVTTTLRHEHTLEELRAANEQLQAINDALRATNEALEADKQELLSANEELVMCNLGLERKLQELRDELDKP